MEFSCKKTRKIRVITCFGFRYCWIMKPVCYGFFLFLEIKSIYIQKYLQCTICDCRSQRSDLFLERLQVSIQYREIDFTKRFFWRECDVEYRKQRDETWINFISTTTSLEISKEIIDLYKIQWMFWRHNHGLQNAFSSSKYVSR